MQARGRERIAVEIAVTVTTVLDSQPGTIVDLTEDGALITGASMSAGTQIVIDLDGYSIFGRVMWTEVDRMGVRFPFPLSEGPLHAALEMARAAVNMPPLPRQAAAARGGFGRRVAR
ncbi:PilZ domain-containing protein [Sphingobium phenoxybenzoativorans]|uniref:PilZ domain-containing protein n=1 Tax=Sphingobium phenoxybenzoativorans TaxID=1592790 RepID=A0A975Q0U4_9SPHN|nr:PilZ domain-containing protein [Sphingobium phenoxybenzoativorans]QUT04976.1 PilZ domain-containing protein [Sphingobium phenoxybenzoativorans]